MPSGRSPQYVVGIDEVGRGPLAGPVTVCVFKIDPQKYRAISFHANIRDSKQLSEKKRKLYATELKQLKKNKICDFAIVSVSALKIDTWGISKAIRYAIRVGLDKVRASTEDIILLDGGLRAPDHFRYQSTIIRGDEKELVIACASIVAKTIRDNYVKKIAKQYPGYGFASHVGYGTKKHRDAIRKYGLTTFHRKTFCKNIKV